MLALARSELSLSVRGPFERLALAALFLAIPGRSEASGRHADAREDGTYQPPRFELRLSLIEFSVLHNAAVLGVSSYRARPAFEVRMLAEGEEVVTVVTIRDPLLLEAWGFWMNERTAEIVNAADIDDLAPKDRLALRVVQSVNAKISEARGRPIWDPVTLTGIVAERDGKLLLTAGDETREVLGEKAPELRAALGKPVVATGLVEAPWKLTLTRFVERRDRVLELFTMSHCPFGRQAVGALIRHIQGFPSDGGAPRLEIRYIFYREPPAEPGGRPVYTALHGEPELVENLLQMLLRDMYPPEVLQGYLLLRQQDAGDWERLVPELGLTGEHIEVLRERLALEREALIEAEYAYVSGTCGILDGSPTYAWEGEIVPDIRAIDAFASLDRLSSTCTSENP